MNKIVWLCVLGLVIATLLPVSQQTPDETGLTLTSAVSMNKDGKLYVYGHSHRSVTSSSFRNICEKLLSAIQRLEADVFKNVHDLNSRIKRHSDGTYTSDVSKSMDQDLAMKFLQQAIEGNLSKKTK